MFVYFLAYICVVKIENNLKSYKMKKLFNMAMVLFSIVALGTSCNKKDSTPVYVSIATIEPGSAITGGFSVVFDTGDTAYVTNSVEVSNQVTIEPTFDNQLRAMIYYVMEEQEVPGYDAVITIQGLRGILTDYVRYITDHDIGNIADYTASMAINEGAYANDWITLNFSFMYGGSSSKEHKVYLVYNTNPDHAGMFQSMYKDDGYLYLELYHDSDEDGTLYEYTDYGSWKLRSDLGIDVNQYKGIKILYHDMNSDAADTFVMDLSDNAKELKIE